MPLLRDDYNGRLHTIAEKYRLKILDLLKIPEKEWINFQWVVGETGYPITYSGLGIWKLRFFNDSYFNIVLNFSLSQLPGCCGICVSHATSIALEYRYRGVGTLLQQMKEDLAKCIGFSQILCTDTPDAKGRINHRLLLKTGWTDIEEISVKNRRTQNVIHVYSKTI